MKKAIVVAIMLICIGLTYLYPHAMLSPGELLAGHQKLNDKCMQCHSAFGGINNAKCITCHKLADIGKDSMSSTSDSAKMKSHLFHQQLSSQQCSSCHTDHKGMQPAKLINGFSHAMLQETVMNNCVSCHIKPVDKVHQFISSACKNCHQTNDWKQGVTFDHEMILGADKTNCITCHQKPADTYHQKVNDNCNKCHGTTKWVPSTFDHTVYFRLDGKHNTQCITCHSNNNYSTYTCYGCHEHSVNNILAKHNEEGITNISNCVSCHKTGNEHDIERSENKSGERENATVKEYINGEKKQTNKEGKEKDDDK